MKVLKKFDNIKIGDTVEFGRIKTQADGELAAIVWRVVDIANGCAKLVSEKILDITCFNEERTIGVEVCYDYQHFKYGYELIYDNDYKKSSLRKLVKSLYDTCFDNNEKQLICEYSKSISDKVCILSVNEVENYFPEHSDRDKQSTPYALSRFENGNCVKWWTRTRSGSDESQYIYAVCTVGIDGVYAPMKLGVVPAIVVEID